MLMKTIGKYMLMPGAGIGLLASFGMFDLGKDGGGPLSVDTSSPAAVGATMLAALEGPLEVARRIAAAGSSIIGGDGEMPDFLSGAGSIGDMMPGGQSVAYSDGGAPTAARKTVSVPQAAQGGSAPAGALGGSGVGKSSRPPQVVAD